MRFTLQPFQDERDDLIALLDQCKTHEVEQLLAHLRAGQFVFWHPDFGLIGQLAALRGQRRDEIGLSLSEFAVWAANMDTETTVPLIELWMQGWLAEHAPRS